MIRFLIRTAIFFLTALVGIVAADVILTGFSVAGWTSYVSVAIIFALIQAVLSPLIGKSAERRAPAFMGGIGLVSTFVALLVTNLVSDSLRVDGASTWIAATVIVWLFGAIAAWVLPLILVKRVVQDRRS